MSFLVSSETNYHAWTQTAQCAAEQPHPTCSSGSGGKGCQGCSLSIDSRPGCDFLSPLKHHFASAQNCSKWQEFAHIIKRGKGKTGREKNLEKSGRKKKKEKNLAQDCKEFSFLVNSHLSGLHFTMNELFLFPLPKQPFLQKQNSIAI